MRLGSGSGLGLGLGFWVEPGPGAGSRKPPMPWPCRAHHRVRVRARVRFEFEFECHGLAERTTGRPDMMLHEGKGAEFVETLMDIDPRIAMIASSGDSGHLPLHTALLNGVDTRILATLLRAAPQALLQPFPARLAPGGLAILEVDLPNYGIDANTAVLVHRISGSSASIYRCNAPDLVTYLCVKAEEENASSRGRSVLWRRQKVIEDIDIRLSAHGVRVGDHVTTSKHLDDDAEWLTKEMEKKSKHSPVQRTRRKIAIDSDSNRNIRHLPKKYFELIGGEPAGSVATADLRPFQRLMPIQACLYRGFITEEMIEHVMQENEDICY